MFHICICRCSPLSLIVCCLCVFQILDGELTDKYHTVQDLVGTKARKVHDAKKKAERLRDEAKDLLKDAQNKLQRLAGEWRGSRPQEAHVYQQAIIKNVGHKKCRNAEIGSLIDLADTFNNILFVHRSKARDTYTTLHSLL